MDYMVTGADGKEYGPVSFDQLRQWRDDNRVGPQTQVRNFHTGQVLMASAIPGLFAATPMAPATDWSRPPVPGSVVYHPPTQTFDDGKGELWHSIARSGLALVMFFALHGIGLVFGAYAMFYAIQCKAKGNRFGWLAIGIASASLVAIIAGWVIRFQSGSRMY